MDEGIGAARRCRVFVSYAHDTESHKVAVRELCRILERDAGIEVFADYMVKDRIEWSRWVEARVLTTHFTLVVASPAYRRAAAADETPTPHHRGVRYEIGILQDKLTEDRDKWLPRILPVVLPGGTVEDIPGFLLPRAATHYLIPNFTLDGLRELLVAIGGGASGTAVVASPATPSPEDLSGHWWPAVRGSRISTKKWFFTGRERAMGEIAEFTRTSANGLRAVTGMPGAGKSALLSALVLRSLREGDLTRDLRAAIPDCGIDVALVASRKGPYELATELIRAFGVTGTDPENPTASLLAWLDGERSRSYTIVIDAVDEALLPKPGRDRADEHSSQWYELMELLNAVSWRARVIIGVRREEVRSDDPLDGLPKELRSTTTEVIDLDDRDKYLTDLDVARYIASLLRADDRPHGYGHSGGWTDQALLGVIGDDGVQRANGNFLIAQFIAEELLRIPPVRDFEDGWSARMRWPDRLEGWVEYDVQRRVTDSERWLKELMVPIAMAGQGGLPIDLWLSVARAFHGSREITDYDLERARQVFRFFLDETGDLVPRYSMRHASFARYFEGRRWGRRATLFYETLLAEVPSGPNGRQWQQACDYVRVNLLMHARAANRVEDLLIEDPACLAAADPDSAVLPMAGLTRPSARLAAHVYRRAGYVRDADFAERIAVFQFHARLIGADVMVRALGRMEAQQPWTVPWRVGGAPSAIALGAVERTSFVFTVHGPHGGPAALLVRPDGRCVVVDAATQARLGPTFELASAGSELPDILTAWSDASKDVRIAVGGSDGSIVVWKAAGRGASGRRSYALPVDHPPRQLMVIGGPHGVKLMCVRDDSAAGLTVWPLRASSERLDAQGGRVDHLASLAGTPTAGAVISATRAGTVNLWRFWPNTPPQGYPLHLGAELRSVAAAGTAQSGCVVVDLHGILRVLWVGATGPLVDSGQDLGEGGPLSRLALTTTGSGALAAIGTSYGQVSVHRLCPPVPPVEIARIDTGGPISSLVFLDEVGSLLAVADWTGIIHVYAVDRRPGADLVTRLPVGEPVSNVLPLGASEEGPMLATRSIGGMTRFWQVESPVETDGLGASAVTHVVGASLSEGRSLVAASVLGGADVWAWTPASEASGARSPIVLSHGEPIEQLAAAGAADGSALLCAAGDGHFTLWRWEGEGPVGQPLTWPTDANLVEHLAVFSTGERQFVCAGGPESVHLWDVTPQAEPGELLDLPDTPVNSMTWSQSPDAGMLLAVGTDDGQVHLVSVAPDGALGMQMFDHGVSVQDVAVSPDPTGRRLIASVTHDGSVDVRDADMPFDESQVLTMPLGVPGTRVAWMVDGGMLLLVTAAVVGPVRLWDLSNLDMPRLVRTCDGPGGRLHHLVQGGDGVVACAFTGGSVMFLGPAGEAPVTARLNCDLADLTWLPAQGWFVAAQGSVLVALRQGVVT
ncbi:TIR domain-containing protein [Streptomyces sp. NPDC057253]|uniref:nSTAND1 domain-containing NTPase n=1 Tax=Streptomyces sp. NPDC057253 TaxID=3346069 RepID=UPI003638CC52